ncbi:OmpA family protein [Flagellimonas eckloniae]|uniref:Cell envelope biogenesis protein OmpA n=1 Tax=Flagellimonas eckloniae TaxID=346185 RepID=A0A0Q0XLT7_9FLAO|nr:OmpA family protein [Allomuricauda eckloniae]KQC29980.1 cell envelope biogenesis protein OmpA [Allomuricauda eckloniae]
MEKAKRISITVLISFFGMVICFAQSKKSKGDNYFFQYDYQKAINAYESDLTKGTISNQQFVNLADAYFHVNNFEKASEIYLSVYNKDTVIGNHRLNKLLESLSKTANKERLETFLQSMSSRFQKEFLENFEFNTQLLENNRAIDQMDFQIFNLNGNSPQSDFSPSFYGEKLLFSSGRSQISKRRYAPAGEGYLNIYEAGIQANGQILTAQPFSEISSSNFHKATPYYSQELRSFFYVMSNTEDGELSFDDNGKNALAIGMQIKDGRFQLLLKDLSTSFYYPFYDQKTERLYFSANFEEGFGGTDIYYVHTNRGQIMSAPINLGPRINSAGNEIAPYIFENSFYFSSDVFYGLGGMDIYKSNVEGDTFSIPVNLGKGVNSSDDDFGLIIRNDGDGLLGYISSNRPGGKGKDDLYGFKVDKKPGLKTLTFKGKVIKAYGNSDVVDKVAVRLWDSNMALLAETYSDDNGNYRLEIPWVKELVLESYKDRYSSVTKKFSEEELKGVENINYNIEISAYEDLVEKKEGQAVVKLKKFFFGRSRAQLTPEIETELDKVVAFVKDFPSVQLRIETYTDSRGGSSTNFRLTQDRSDAIKNYLVQNGVSSSNILYSVGYGENKIINNCTNGVFCLEMLHQQNQRSLIVILNDNILFE